MKKNDIDEGNDSKMLDLFVVCAEKSGDSLGYNYIQKLLKENPNKKISGVLGPKLSTLNIEKFMDIEHFSVMGFVAVFKKILPLIRSFYKIKKKILKENPNTVLLIDSPDLSLRLAKSLKKGGYTGNIIQYVCPSIWAWRASRKKLIDLYIDELLCLLEFEPRLFVGSNVNTRLMPHPMLDEIKNYKYPFNLKEIKGKKILLLLPGSRISDIKKHLPMQLEISAQFKELVPCVLIAQAKHLIAITKILVKYKTNPYLIEPDAKFDIMRRAHVAIAKCGSSNLELALHKTPSVIMYNPSKFDHFIAKHIFKINNPFFSLPNIILNKPVYQEHIKERPNKERITKSIKTLLLKENYSLCKKNCKELMHLMEKN